MCVYLLLSQPTLAHKEDTKLFYTYPFILYSDNIVLTAKSAVIFFKYITLRTNIKKVQYTTNSVPHFFRQIGQDLTFIA